MKKITYHLPQYIQEMELSELVMLKKQLDTSSALTDFATKCLNEAKELQSKSKPVTGTSLDYFDWGVKYATSQVHELYATLATLVQNAIEVKSVK